MILLDAYALVALLRAERAGADVRTLLRSGDCGMTASNLAEAADVLERVHGIGIGESRPRVEPLPLTVVDVDARLAWRAAELRARHYRRRSSEVSMADCVLVAAARPGSDAVATADRAVAVMSRAEGVHVTALPDRRGRRPA